MSEINLSDLPQTEIVDVHIASVWSRVAAYLLNYLFNVIIFYPITIFYILRQQQLPSRKILLLHKSL